MYLYKIKFIRIIFYYKNSAYFETTGVTGAVFECPKYLFFVTRCPKNFVIIKIIDQLQSKRKNKYCFCFFPRNFYVFFLSLHKNFPCALRKIFEIITELVERFSSCT